MTLTHLKHPFDDTRPEIYDAIESIIDRFRSGELNTSINFPPRFGKTAVIHGSGLEFSAIGSPPLVCLSPWDFLADQVKDSERIKSNFRRYKVLESVSFTSHRCKRIRDHLWWKMANDVRPNLISMTVGLAYANKPAFIDGISIMFQDFGIRVPLAFDEVQLAKLFQQWGRFVQEIQDAGAYIISLTGTPVPGLPGFNGDFGEWKTKAGTLVRRKYINGELKQFVQKRNNSSRDVKIEATKTVLWRQAWDRDALAHVNAIWIDPDVFEHDELIGKLSKLDEKDLAGKLKDIIEEDHNTALAAQVAIDRLLECRRRKGREHTQMLVVTGYDEHERNDSNYHAREYKRALNNALNSRGADARSFNIEIATGINDNGEPDNDAVSKLRRFTELGTIDILIVKMMGLVGLDRQELKIMIFASPIRKGPLFKQALSRPLTQWNGMSADIIMFKDKSMVESYGKVVKDQGGEKERKSELVEEEEVPYEEPPEHFLHSDNPEVVQYSDDIGNNVVGDYESVLREIKRKYDVEKLTDVVILSNFQKGAFPVSQDNLDKQTQPQSAGVRDLDQGLEDLEGKFGREAKRIVGKYVDYGEDPKKWVDKLRELQGRAKRHCGVLSDLHDIDDVALLGRLIDALKQTETQMFGGHHGAV